MSECEVEITNLRKAGIAATYDDLCDIGFQLTDLVVNRSLFNVGHIVQLYGMDAVSLNLSVDDLMICKFLPAELLTLQFSLPGLIEAGGIRGRHLQILGYSLSNLIQLGLTKKHLKLLGITMPIAINTLRWNPMEVNQMV